MFQSKPTENTLTFMDLEDSIREQAPARLGIIVAEVQESRAVSYTDYYAEKLQQQQIDHNWPPPQESVDADLPELLRGMQTLPKGAETAVVRPFLKRLLEQTALVQGYALYFLESRLYKRAHKTVQLLKEESTLSG
jgi:hypothetical protein